MRALSCSLVLLAGLFAGSAHADDTRAEWQLGERSDTPHVDVPFTLDLVVAGFDETPQPEVPKLEIPDASVQFVAVQPNVQRGMQIINGRRSDFVRVTWVVRWRVEPHKAGRMRIPAVTITQGSKKASTQSAEAQVDTVQTTDAMKLSLALPDRPIFVGETVPVTLTWLFRGQPQDDPRWSVPLMTSDAFTVSGPPSTQKGQNGKLLTFPAGGKDLQLPYALDQVDQNGVKFNRLSATFFIAPRKTGKIDVPASSVVVSLPVGRADFFGNAPSELFRALDVPRTLEVKPLPESDRPPSFAGAVGEQFSIEVRTSRSVVQLGEPFELQIQVKSNQRLDTLALGKLDGPGGLPKEKFTVPADPPTGELSDDGKTKVFKVTAQVTGAANEVPAIAFAYFDPTKGTYQTIHSEPIALSVKGGSVVGADEVITSKPKTGAPVENTDALVNVNADLALSAGSDTDARPIGGTLVWVLVGLLYAIPLALLAARTWQLRTAGQREEAAEVRAARKRVEELLDRSGSAPAREIAGPLAAAFRDLARVSNRPVADGGLLAKLETESFAPAAAAVPLSPDLRSDAAGLLRRWTTEARRARSSRKAAAAVVLLASLFGAHAHADALDDGRAAYKDAMAQPPDGPARKAAFRRAATALAEAARTAPDRPELLTDWGNAALGAGDIATATLAYRRALAIDPSNARARHNLAWLRSRQGDAFRPQAAGTADTLLFFHSWPRTRKLLIGAGAFALAVLLLVPWSGRRRRGLTGLALVPFAVWLAMLASVILEDRHGDDAVVMDDVVLRAADSTGAPAALPQPVPRGVEVTVLERRDAWTKIQLAGGIAGWLPAGAVERVSP